MDRDLVKKVDDVAENLAPVLAFYPDRDCPFMLKAEDAMFARNIRKRNAAIDGEGEKRFLDTVDALVTDMKQRDFITAPGFEKLSKALDVVLDRDKPERSPLEKTSPEKTSPEKPSNVINMQARAAQLAFARGLGY